MSVATELTAGGVAGAAGILATQPLDTIRIRLQSCSAGLGIGSAYTGAFDCARSALRTEGVRGLYKGVASPTLTCGVMNACLFFSYDYASAMSRRYSGSGPDADLTLGQVWCAGVASGLASAFITGPTELVKVSAQTNLKNEGRIYEEWLILRGMVKDHGWLSPHGPSRGLMITVLRDTPSFGFYFMVYEAGTRHFGKNDLSSFCCGGAAGAVAWAAIYPLDVLKTRWSTAPPGKFTSLRHCLKSVLAEGGPRTFYRGFGATMARAFPQNGVIFCTYEFVKSLMTKSPSL